LFVVAAVGTAIDAPPDRLKPQYPLELGIEGSREIRGRPTVQVGLMTARSTELPSHPLILQEEPADSDRVREGLEELTPDLFALTHNADIEALISKKKGVIRGDLRAPQYDPTFG
jgi:hypothetical protein